MLITLGKVKRQGGLAVPKCIFPHTVLIDLLSPNSDQHQFSPNKIHRLSRAKSMRINKMITKRKVFDLKSNSLN